MSSLRRLLAAVFVGLLGVGPGAAQTFPNRPVTIVVPFAAGGPTDTLARILAERLRAALDQSVIIENVTGASGSIAVGRVARAAPDGYTLSIGHVGTHVLNGAIYNLQYDLLKDLEPIALVANNPQLVIAKADMPANDLPGAIAWLKANPGKASVGSAGAGSPSHVAALYFQTLTGTQFQIIPYRGAGPAMQDILAGQIDMMFDQASNSLPQVRGGKIKAYAVTAPGRLAAAPEIPSVDEAGAPGLHVAVWHGLWAPKGTSADVIQRLNAAVVETLADERVRTRLAELGQEIPAREQQKPEALAAHHKAETDRWWPVLKAANIKAE
jgi:tripartite-type tricarboxylate transporter receptor subunit TctC